MCVLRDKGIYRRMEGLGWDVWIGEEMKEEERELKSILIGYIT